MSLYLGYRCINDGSEQDLDETDASGEVIWISCGCHRTDGEWHTDDCANWDDLNYRIQEEDSGFFPPPWPAR